MGDELLIYKKSNSETDFFFFTLLVKQKLTVYKRCISLYIVPQMIGLWSSMLKPLVKIIIVTKYSQKLSAVCELHPLTL